MNSKRLALALLASSSLLLAACGSDDESSNGDSAAATSCPDAAPSAEASPQWTFSGTTGEVEVIGSTDTTAPKITVTTPFSVDQTEVQTLTAGDGDVVPPTAEVSVCYVGVNGRDGEEFDSSYTGGAPVEFPLDGVIPGFQKAIAGQTVGSTVAVAMAGADGYATGNPAAGIEAGDTLVFAIKILAQS